MFFFGYGFCVNFYVCGLCAFTHLFFHVKDLLKFVSS